MKKFKIFTAGILAYLMLISLVPSNFLVKEVKALSNDYNIITKENSQVIGGYVYKNKMILAYNDDSDKSKISLIENGEENILEEVEKSFRVSIYNSNINNIIIMKLERYDEGIVKKEYRKLNLSENKIYTITEDEYSSLGGYTFEELEEEDNTKIDVNWSEDEKEELLKKINTSLDLNLTISDKNLEELDQNSYKYVNDDEAIYIELNFIDNKKDIIKFSVGYVNEKINKRESHSGVVYGDYFYVNDKYSTFLPIYKVVNDNLFIFTEFDREDNGYMENEIIKVNKDGLISRKTIDKTHRNAEVEIKENYLYITYPVRIGQTPTLYVYKEGEDSYDLVKEIKMFGSLRSLEDDSQLFITLDDNKVKLIKLKDTTIEELDDFSDVIDPDSLIGIVFSIGTKNNFVFNLGDNKIIIMQKNIENQIPSAPGEDNTVIPPVEDNKPSQNTTLDIEVPTLNANDVNEIPVVSSKTTNFNIILKDVEALKNGEGSLKLALNNVTLNLPFSVVDSNLIDANDTVSVKLDIIKDSEITKDLKAVNKVFDFNIVVNKENEGVKIHNFKDGLAEITISLSDEELEGLNKNKLKVYYYNEETNEFEAMETKVEGNNITFKTSHFSKYVIAEEIVENNVTTPEKDDTVTITPDEETNSNTNNSNTSTTIDTQGSKNETGKGSLPQTGAVVSSSVILVVALGLVLVGGIVFFRKKKDA